MKKLRTEKSIIIAYVIWFFIGHFGVHRFYLGRIKTGLAMIGFLVLLFAMLLLMAALAESGSLSDMGLAVLSIGSVVVMGIWFIWYIADLVMIPIMIARDRERHRHLDQATAARVFE